MKKYALLWSKILDSSLWVKESMETRIVFLTLLAMKDHDGEVYASVVGLADRAKVPVDKTREALKILTSPDPDDTSKVDEGRRIKEIQGGWRIVNHELYRYTSDEKREYWARKKREQRAKDAIYRAKSKPLKNEPAAMKALESGNLDEYDRLTAMRETHQPYQVAT